MDIDSALSKSFAIVMSEASQRYPEVRIKSGWLLRDEISTRLSAAAGELESYEDLGNIVEGYRSAWLPKQTKIVQGLCSIFNLAFRHNIIDVYIAPRFNAISDPLVIGTGYKPNSFVNILTHEMSHRLLTDNTTYESGLPLLEHWKKLFGDHHSFNTLIHIPVHAGLEAMYRDVLEEPERVGHDIQHCAELEDYKGAWEYVSEKGYRDVIDRLISSHQEFACDNPVPGASSS